MKNSEFTYDIVEHIAILGAAGSWQTELNLISWNGAPAKYDIRKWNDDHSKMGKGISLSKGELKTLLSLEI